MEKGKEGIKDSGIAGWKLGDSHYAVATNLVNTWPPAPWKPDLKLLEPEAWGPMVCRFLSWCFCKVLEEQWTQARAREAAHRNGRKHSFAMRGLLFGALLGWKAPTGLRSEWNNYKWCLFSAPQEGGKLVSSSLSLDTHPMNHTGILGDTGSPCGHWLSQHLHISDILRMSNNTSHVFTELNSKAKFSSRDNSWF